MNFLREYRIILVEIRININGWNNYINGYGRLAHNPKVVGSGPAPAT